MDDEAIQKLISINRKFYQTFALQFSDTRLRLQPGVARLLTSIPKQSHILDLGCGNGELACSLAERNFNGSYIGLDSSEPLLEIARGRFAGNFPATFLNIDLTQPEWNAILATSPEIPRHPPYDIVLAFAVLHHLPGSELRKQVLKIVRSLLGPRGIFIHSEWLFLNSPRLRERIQSWEAIGVNANQVDPRDYLLDWRRGGLGLRYVHHFSLPELEDLASETGFEISDSFQSDGEGGNLGLYQVWRPI